MSSCAVIHKRLDDYVREQSLETGPGRFNQSRLGLSREGSFVNSWQMNIQRIGYFANAYMVRDFGDDSCVQILVPPTETGVVPSENEQQPFGWTGMINEYTAELAVWWAFELVSDDEARLFMREHRPMVLFRYYDDGGYRELEAKFNGEALIVEKIM